MLFYRVEFRIAEERLGLIFIPISGIWPYTLLPFQTLRHFVKIITRAHKKYKQDQQFTNPSIITSQFVRF